MPVHCTDHRSCRERWEEPNLRTRSTYNNRQANSANGLAGGIPGPNRRQVRDRRRISKKPLDRRPQRTHSIRWSPGSGTATATAHERDAAPAARYTRTSND